MTILTISICLQINFFYFVIYEWNPVVQNIFETAAVSVDDDHMCLSVTRRGMGPAVCLEGPDFPRFLLACANDISAASAQFSYFTGKQRVMRASQYDGVGRGSEQPF